MYYGMPETDLKKLSALKTDVLGIFAKQDKWINDAVVAQFQKDMKKDRKKLTVKTFDADHAFANPSNPVYNKEYAEDAHKLSLAFLKARLK
jgi:carboxymethylenebutenolidase